MCWPLSPHHVDQLRAIDQAWLSHIDKGRPERAAAKAQPINPTAFDAVFGWKRSAWPDTTPATTLGTEAAERRQAKHKVTLAGRFLPIFNRDKQRHVVGEVVKILLNWSHSPFENEGATVAGLRSQLCVQGYGWGRSDHQARDVVATALRKVGAQRPSYDQGQRRRASARSVLA